MADYILSAKITGDASSFKTAFGEAEEKIKGTGEKIEGFGTKTKEVGSNVTKFGAKVGLVSAPVALMGKGIFDTGMEFEKSMSSIQAISGATGSDLELLEAKAREMGKTTKYSASESADAMGFMALAGWDTQQMMDGLPDVLSLASAGGLELARASEIVTGNINAFGLEATDASRVADVLAAAQANSGASAEDLASALEVVAPAAAGAGHEIEGTSALIGILADQNIKGSKAGTYLNSMYSDLQKSAKDGSVAIGDSSVAVYDASGNMRDMTDIMVDVDKATAGMTQEQKDQALAGVFQQQSLKGVNALLNAGTDELKGLEGELNNSSGAAKEMADIMSDNLAGKVDGMKSSFGELQIALFDTASGGMETIIEKITGLIDWFSSLDEGVLSTIMMVGGIIAVAAPLIMMIGSLISAIGTIAGAISFLMSPMGLIVLAIAAVIAIGVLLWKNWDTIKEKASELGARIGEIWDGIKEKTSAIWTSIKEFLSGVWDGIVSIATALWDGLKAYFVAYWTFVGDIFLFAVELIKSIVQGAFTVLVTIVRLPMEIIKAIVTTIWNYVGDFITTTWDKIKSVVTTATEAVQKIIKTVFDKIKDISTKVWNSIKDTISKVWDGIKSVISKVTNTIKGIVDKVWDAIKTKTSNVWNAIKSTTSTIWNNVKTAIMTPINSARDLVTTAITTMKTNVTNKFNEIKSAATDKFNAAKDAMIKPIEAAKDKISGIIDAIKGFFSGLKLKFPKITMPKLPRFSMTGKFGFKPPSVPKLGIKWHAKGGIFNSPTLLGGGNGVGEAGAEAVLPIAKLSDIMAKMMKSLGYGNADNGMPHNIAMQYANQGNMDSRLLDSSMGGNNNVNVTITDAKIYDTRDIREISKDLAEHIGREVVFG